MGTPWELADTFLSACGDASVGAVGGDGASLQSRLVDAHATGAAAWPEIELAPLDYVRHLAARVARTADPAAALERSQHADLYLACGCALGDARSVAAFERAFIARVPLYTSRIRLDDEARQEVIDRVRERLLVSGADGRAPRIADYLGQGSLEGWVRACAVRIAIDIARERDDPSAPGAASDEADLLAADSDPTVLMLRQRYQREFQSALQEALQDLGGDDRTLLRMYFLDRLKVEQIGRVLQLDKSNVSRRIARARARVLEETKKRLSVRLGLGATTFGSVLRAVRSELRVSMTRLLGGGDPPAQK